MSKLSITDKRIIAARLFFVDNRDSYDDFKDALDEFLDGKNQSDKFIDAVVNPIMKKTEGHILLMSPNGHVANLRLSDNFFSPLTQMTLEEGEALEKQFETTNNTFPEDDELEILKKMGWKTI